MSKIIERKNKNTKAERNIALNQTLTWFLFPFFFTQKKRVSILSPKKEEKITEKPTKSSSPKSKAIFSVSGNPTTADDKALEFQEP